VNVRRRIAGALAGGIALLAAGTAEAYVRSRTDANGAPFYWKTSCVPATIYTNGFEATAGGLTVDKVAKSVAAAAHAWGPDAVTCPGTPDGHPLIEIVPTLSTDAVPPAIAWDSKNAIVIRTDAWSKSGKPGMEYAFDALAVTTVTARGDAHIVDADIEVNAISKNWLDLDPGVVVSGGQSTYEYFDLQNTLTHEFGHFLGLDHTCYNPALGKLPPLDDAEQPVPDCANAPSEVAMTVMFDRADPLQTSKRTLSDDDKRAVCEIYDKPLTCELDQPQDGCAVAPVRAERRGGGRWRELGALLVGVVALVVARRRARG
jgi:hypothetical protein